MARGKSIKCIETNEIYGSLSEACRETGMTYDVLKKCIDNGMLASDGREYVYLDEYERDMWESKLTEDAQEIEEDYDSGSELDASSAVIEDTATPSVPEIVDISLSSEKSSAVSTMPAEKLNIHGMTDQEQCETFDWTDVPGKQVPLSELIELSNFFIDKGVDCGIVDNEYLIFFNVDDETKLKTIRALLHNFNYVGKYRHTKWSQDRYTILTS